MALAERPVPPHSTGADPDAEGGMARLVVPEPPEPVDVKAAEEPRAEGSAATAEAEDEDPPAYPPDEGGNQTSLEPIKDEDPPAYPPAYPPAPRNPSPSPPVSLLGWSARANRRCSRAAL
jgi:hypothetical protein